MEIIMVTLRYPTGADCPKCEEAKQFLRARGHWERVTRVVPAEPGQADGEGRQLADKHGIDLMPFFVVRDGDEERVYRSVLKLTKEVLTSQ